MTAEQTKRELTKIEFDRFYQRREAGREGPSPEAQGREEARTLIYLDRSLAANGEARCGKCRKRCAGIVCEWREPVCDECWRRMNGDAA